MRILLVLSFLALTGCETVGGLGRDISNTADAVQDAF